MSTDTTTSLAVAKDYPQYLDVLLAACRTINAPPLRELAEANEHMQALGPLLEPTAYLRGGGQNLHDQRRIIDAARALQLACEEVALKEGVTA
jgi:hypothetical protein